MGTANIRDEEQRAVDRYRRLNRRVVRSGPGVSDAFRQQRVYCRLAFSPVP